MTLAPVAFDYVRDIVRRESAIVLEPGKEYLVEARLLPLARQAGERDVSSYVERVRGGREPGGTRRLVEALTTNETSWFRDSEPFTALTTHVMPELVRARPDRTIRVWSAACSSGQEAYSIAMTLQDYVRQGWRLDILATDLSQEMVDKTRAGRYSQLEVNRGLPASMLVQHFRRDGAEWQVSEDLRRHVTVRQLNLASPLPPLGSFDVVMLRNVLIYFDIETKRSILRRIRPLLRPDGWLFLGTAETTLGIDESWQRVVVGRTSIHRPTLGG
ncbi:MAG: CheR family methyltransferase [Actinomycetales bacterium]